jgi:predicted pyridoxine 5'-phosphate oxidase superfamily flavin-nucleotide-binding protein
MTSPSELAAGPLTTEDPQPAAPATAWHTDATATASPADEREVADQGGADRSMTFSVSGAEPEPIPESSAAGATASESTRWHEIQVMFVDDPRSAVELAAGLVDDSSQALVAFVKEQQDSLLAAWHGEDAGTEELRVALQHYRAFGTRLADFSRET